MCRRDEMVFERRSIVSLLGASFEERNGSRGRSRRRRSSSSSERTTTTIDASSSSSTSHPGADQIEFVYLFSPSSSSFAGMRLSLSSRRSRGNEEERSPQDKDKRTSTDQHHRFFLFPNHNRDPNKNTTGVARKDHQNVCCETEPKTREASRDSSGHLPSEWASEEEWRDVRRRQVDGRRGQLQRHVHER